MLSFIKKLLGLGEQSSCCNSCCQTFDLQKDLNLNDTDLEILQNLDDNIVIGKVEAISAHTDPEITKVKITNTKISDTETLQILCGGTNLEEGDIVPVAKIGTKLSEDFTIGERAIRGEKSFGMICARAELGLSPAEEEKGQIWRLPEVCENFIGEQLKNL
ncbi:MAG: hypothetical protein OEL89_03665 [Candidatus Peregrinibacteria bacterium]|nr:hypothetical protein [Candidatus Peregrinibacteria bacterium]